MEVVVLTVVLLTVIGLTVVLLTVLEGAVVMLSVVYSVGVTEVGPVVVEAQQRQQHLLWANATAISPDKINNFRADIFVNLLF